MKILIIEDNQEIINILKPSLESECFVIDSATDGEQGSYLARINHYDLIICDNNLPKKSGKQICQEIRGDGKNVPILILSVMTDTNSKIDLLNAGADDYLNKPYSFAELLARVRALLRRQDKISENVIKIADLVLDSQKHLVTRAKQEIKLTKKEFILLEYLMKNNDTILTRSMILEHVWDMNADPFSNTIEAHIRSLRNKIDQSHQKKLITTVSGCGYKISA